MPPEIWAFVGVAALIVVVPGADMAIVARNTIMGGRHAGWTTATGTILGCLVHATAAVVGLSVVIAASAFAFTVVKVAGAAYLVWLGVQTLWAARRGDQTTSPADENPTLRSPVVQGMLTNVLNPKLAVFFLSFLPQFVDSTRPATPQIVVLAGTFIVMGAIWLGIYVSVVDSFAVFLARPKIKLWFERVVGTALIALGVRLAFVTSK